MGAGRLPCIDNVQVAHGQLANAVQRGEGQLAFFHRQAFEFVGQISEMPGDVINRGKGMARLYSALSMLSCSDPLIPFSFQSDRLLHLLAVLEHCLRRCAYCPIEMETE